MMIGGGGKMEDNIWQDTINLPGRWAVRARIGDYRWEYWTILVYAGGGISEENENGTVEITVFTNEVRIFNIHTLRSMFVSPLRPYLRMDGLVYSSQIQQSADAFLGALSLDEFQDPTSRISKRKEEQFAAFKNASNILDVITAAKPK